MRKRLRRRLFDAPPDQQDASDAFEIMEPRVLLSADALGVDISLLDRDTEALADAEARTEQALRDRDQAIANHQRAVREARATLEAAGVTVLDYAPPAPHALIYLWLGAISADGGRTIEDWVYVNAPYDTRVLYESRDGSLWIELALSVYAFVLLLLAVRLGNWGLVFWLSLFSAGYAYIAGLGFKQSFSARRPVPGTQDIFPVTSPPNSGQD